MNDAKHSSPNEHSSPSDATKDGGSDKKPFVEPELRCETDLVGGTAHRSFFETDTVS